MKHAGSIQINKPKEVVARFFADPAYLGEYQDGFIRKELVSGQEGQTGAVSRMYYKYGKRDMIMTETITRNDLPDAFEAHYHHKHMDNTWQCRFTSLDENRTEYSYAFEYTRIDWFMPRLIAILFPGVYRKQGEKWMRQFKEFVEAQ